ncbi:hypothetical protein OGAPHI_007324 [Ogataea philodendri]|uniref:Uncharacterized protein n=1 Tax=Ogataea philodendri TaxID=1378263 RepID=A0A9P8NW42_9ASCO|nr:uncharacterized protein OGAPHI_007324 [Ogataea philodendri]KAH3660119.1 hypothetical protein OGAPHI_007324 [Ogataea philodendri]
MYKLGASDGGNRVNLLRPEIGMYRLSAWSWWRPEDEAPGEGNDLPSPRLGSLALNSNRESGSDRPIQRLICCGTRISSSSGLIRSIDHFL